MSTIRRKPLARWTFALMAGGVLGMLGPDSTRALAQEPGKKDEALEKLLEKLDGPKPAPSEPADAPRKPDAKPDPDKKPAPEADPKGKDDALEKLLERLDGPNKPAAENPKADPAQPGSAPKADADKKPAPPSGEVGDKDRSLDELLQGLGETKDKPKPDEQQPGGGGGEPPTDPAPPAPGGAGGDEAKKDAARALDRTEQKLDDRLEELTGRKPKKPDQKPKQGQGQGGGGGKGGEDEDQGPLGDLVKQMRDVEERLSKPDTGAETQKKQTEIVQNLETLLEQARQGGGKGMRMARGPGKLGGPQQQGQGQGNQAGAQGVGASKPATPRTPPTPVELTKAIWGHLPASVRDDMSNVMKESPLPGKADMIRLYYLSLGKKSATRGE